MRDASMLQVAIDARLTPQVWGGVAHAAKGLIQGLSQLDGGDEHYRIIVSSDEQRDWIGPHLGANQELVDARAWRPPAPWWVRPPRSLLERAMRKAKGYVRAGARRVLGNTEPAGFAWPQVEVSDGFFESLGCSVMHFPSQRFVVCAIPSVYNPHDLQHLHYPQFFSAPDIAYREVVWRTGCQLAQCVMVGSEWVKNDVVHSYGIDPRRVQVMPEGAPTQFMGKPDAAGLGAVTAKFGLATPFVLYPAMTWAHKNHIRLFEAMRLLRDDAGISVQLVCTGARYEPFWPEIERAVTALQLQDQVRFLGFLSEADLAAVYGAAGALILPSLFEASSLPIFEAWHAGVPVASSSATALPEQVMDAALLFDPLSISAIAQALRRVLTDRELRAGLVARGTARLRDFDWRQTAKGYRAVYRRTAGRRLTDEDRWLLSWESMRDAGSRPPQGAAAQSAGAAAHA